MENDNEAHSAPVKIEALDEVLSESQAASPSPQLAVHFLVPESGCENLDLPPSPPPLPLVSESVVPEIHEELSMEMAPPVHQITNEPPLKKRRNMHQESIPRNLETHASSGSDTIVSTGQRETTTQDTPSGAGDTAAASAQGDFRHIQGPRRQGQTNVKNKRPNSKSLSRKIHQKRYKYLSRAAMFRERRSKHANDRRQARQPTPPPPEPERYDTESSEHLSGEYTERAEDYETEFFPIPTRRMFNHFNILRQRKCENTRKVDLDTLREFGIEDQFLHLTGRIGFSPTFWAIEANSYNKLTKEFLSSLQLKKDVQEQPYIKFRMCHQTHHVWVSDLRKWFGFHLEPQTDVLFFREDMTKEHFWNLVSGMAATHSKDYRGRNITHPVLRCIQRALACTIFARGETVARANKEDLMLLAHMLRPNEELQHPDLMTLMIEHWLNVQQSKRVGGNITCCAYVSYIAEKLGLQITGDKLCKGPTSLDVEAFRSGHFIRTQRGAAGRRDRHYWLMPNGIEYRLPFEAPLSFTDRSTWLFTAPPPPQAPPPPPPVTDAPMTDAPSSSHQVHDTSTAEAGSYPANPTLQDVYRLMHDMSDSQREHGVILRDIQHQMRDYGGRIQVIEDELHDWRKKASKFN
ncbi:uncharacterized protein LOC144547731 [Carex rostrata]